MSRAESPRHRTIVASLATFGGIFFRALSGLLTVRLCLTFLGKETFAVWVFIQNASSYFSLSEAGVGQSTLNEQGDAYAKHDEQRMNQILVSATALYLVFIAIAALLACLAVAVLPASTWLPKEVSNDLVNQVAPLLLTAIAFVLCAVPLTSFGATLSGARFHHIRQILDALLPLFVLATLATVLFVGGGLKAAVLVTPISQIVWGGVYIFFVKKYIPSVSFHYRDFSLPIARKMLGNSAFFFLIGFCLLGFRAIPTLMVGRNGTVDDVANIYALVLLIRVLGWSVVDSVSRVVQPYIILFNQRQEFDRIRFFTRLGTAMTSFGGALLVIAILAFGDRILKLWIGNSAPPAFGILEALCGSFMLDIALLPVFNTMIALNRHRRLGVVLALQSILMILASEIFVRSGLWSNASTAVLIGIAFASLVSFIAAGPMVASKGLEISYRDFLRSILLRPLVYIGMAILAAVSIYYLPNSLLIRSSFFAIALLATAAISWWLILDRPERDFLDSLAKLRERR